jgi:hypothetical protein
MRKLYFALGGLCSLMMSGCAAVNTGALAAGPVAALEQDDETSSYGKFLAGQAAINDGETTAAEDFFGKAAGLESGEDQNLLATRTFTSALLAGDVARAAQVAPTGPQTEASLRHLGALVRAVDALSTGKPRLARTLLTGPDSGAPDEPAAALLTPFAAAAAGDADASIVHPRQPRSGQAL